MPAPEFLITQEELENAITAEKLKQLLGTKGKSEADPARVQMVLSDATGDVLGRLKIQAKVASIDELWDTQWTDRDKAEIRRLVRWAAVYYAHLAGQKGEEVPPTVEDAYGKIEARCQQIAEHTATLSADPEPAAATQNEWQYAPGAGRYPDGSPRKRWSAF